jgi:hypothetical protein
MILWRRNLKGNRLTFGDEHASNQDFDQSSAGIDALGGSGGRAVGVQTRQALSLGKALAASNVQSKGRRLGIFKPSPKEPKNVREQKRGEEFWVDLLGRSLPAMNAEEGVRAVVKAKPI